MMINRRQDFATSYEQLKWKHSAARYDYLIDRIQYWKTRLNEYDKFFNHENQYDQLIARIQLTIEMYEDELDRLRKSYPKYLK